MWLPVFEVLQEGVADRKGFAFRGRERAAHMWLVWPVSATRPRPLCALQKIIAGRSDAFKTAMLAGENHDISLACALLLSA